MAQVVDSLIVTLGLDPKSFTSGQKQAASSLLDFRKSVSDASDGIAGELLSLSKKFTAFFLGFEGLRGAIDLLKDTTEQFREMDLTAGVLGESLQKLRTWREVSQLAGGSAADAQNFQDSMQQAVANFQLQGQMDPRFLGLARIGLNPLAMDWTDPSKFFPQIAAALSNAPGGFGSTIHGKILYGETQLGLPAFLAKAFADGSWKKLLSTSQKTNSTVTDKQGQAAVDLGNKMIDLKYKVQNLAAESFPLLDSGADELTGAFVTLKKVLDEIINSRFVKWIESLVGTESKATVAEKRLAARPDAPDWLKHGVSINPMPGLISAGNFFAAVSRDTGAIVHGAEQYGGGFADWIKSFFVGVSTTPSAAHGNAAPGAAGASGDTNIAIGNITIQTDGDPEAIASGTINALKRKLLNSRFDNGVTP